jgi:hypothetical protein
MPPVPQPQPEPQPEAQPHPHPHPTLHVVELTIDTTTTTKTYHHVVKEYVSAPAYKVDTVEHPALVPGDVEIFEAEFLDAQGKKFSREIGVWTLVQLPRVWHADIVHKWKDGDLTVQLVQDLDDPPTKKVPWRFAITGGTGDYLGAYGQIEFVDYTDITFRFWVP